MIASAVASNSSQVHVSVSGIGTSYFSKRLVFSTTPFPATPIGTAYRLPSTSPEASTFSGSEPASRNSGTASRSSSAPRPAYEERYSWSNWTTSGMSPAAAVVASRSQYPPQSA